MRDYRKLRVWESAHTLALDVYRDTGGFPRHERFGLVAQLRRAVVSIPANIAEGSGRTSRADYARFLDMAVSSASEVEYQLLLARDLGYMDVQTYGFRQRHVEEVRRRTQSLRVAILSEMDD